MPKDFGALVRPIIETRLVPGESLKGIAAAVQQKIFSGQLIAIGVTDLRLVLQAVSRKTEAKGEPLIVTHDDVDSVELEGAADGWWTAPNAVLNANALALSCACATARS